MIPSKQSTTKSASAQMHKQGDEESELRRNEEWISTKEDEKQEQGIRIDK